MAKKAPMKKKMAAKFGKKMAAKTDKMAGKGNLAAKLMDKEL